MRGSRKFCQRGSNLDNFFIGDEERDDLHTTAGHHWRADDGPTLNAGFAPL